MCYRGVVRNGVIVLEGAPTLPDGTTVEVNTHETTSTDTFLGQRLQKLAGLAQGLPEDMAENHDHYLHGRSKK